MTSEADQILARVKAAYAACRSYKDDGTVTTTFFSLGKRTHKLPFSTRFVRPDGFLFEFRSRRGEEDWDQYAVWMENGQARMGGLFIQCMKTPSRFRGRSRARPASPAARHTAFRTSSCRNLTRIPKTRRQRPPV